MFPSFDQVLFEGTVALVMTPVSQNRGENETEDEEKYSRPSTPSDQRDSLLSKADDNNFPVNHVRVSSKWTKIVFYYLISSLNIFYEYNCNIHTLSHSYFLSLY